MYTINLDFITYHSPCMFCKKGTGLTDLCKCTCLDRYGDRPSPESVENNNVVLYL